MCESRLGILWGISTSFWAVLTIQRRSDRLLAKTTISPHIYQGFMKSLPRVYKGIISSFSTDYEVITMF